MSNVVRVKPDISYPCRNTADGVPTLAQTDTRTDTDTQHGQHRQKQTHTDRTWTLKRTRTAHAQDTDAQVDTESEFRSPSMRKFCTFVQFKRIA